jgi:hypothetical protein
MSARAAYRPAVSPAGPPPMTTTSKTFSGMGTALMTDHPGMILKGFFQKINAVSLIRIQKEVKTIQDEPNLSVLIS